MNAPASGSPALNPAQIRHRPLLMGAIMVATVIQFLDAAIANVSLPHMQASLGATVDSIAWVLTSFILASAVAIPITGWLADRVGARQLFLGSLGGFIIASMLCGAATSLSAMVIFRVMQGICAAFIAPLSQSIMLDITPRHRHARALALWGMVTMLAPIFGPILGGYLTEELNWRWIFYINLPLGLPTLLVLWWLLPNAPTRPRRFDAFGFVAIAIALSAFQLMLDRGQQEDWFDSWEIRFEAIVAVSAFWVFLVHIFTAREPIFTPSMFRSRIFSSAMAFMVVMGFLMFGLSAMLPSLLQSVYGYPVIDAGILTAPRGIGILVSMMLIPTFMRYFERRWLIGSGFAIAGASVYMMTGWSIDMERSPIVVAGLIQGVGMGLTFIPLNTMAFEALAPQLRTEGASLLNLMRSLGASVGISIFAANLGRSIQTSHQEIGEHLTGASLGLLNNPALGQLGELRAGALTALEAEVNRQAAMIGYLNNFQLLLIMIALILPLAILLKSPKFDDRDPAELRS